MSRQPQPRAPRSSHMSSPGADPISVNRGVPAHSSWPPGDELVNSTRVRCTRADDCVIFAVMTAPHGDSPVEQALTGGTPSSGRAGTASTSPTSAGSGRPRSNRSTATNPAPSPRQPRNWCSLTNTPTTTEHVAATLGDIRRTRKPFSTRHRIITVQGATRDVVVIGERLHDDDAGEVIGTQGFYLDVTPTNEERRRKHQPSPDRNRRQTEPAIEQAKGRTDVHLSASAPTAAFDVLRWRSQVSRRQTACPRRASCWPTSARSRHDKGAPLSRQTFDELFPESPRTRGSQKHITRSVTGSAYAEFVPGERASSLPRARRRTHHLAPAAACDAVVYGPPLNSHCTALNGPRLCESLTPGARSLGVAA